MKNANAAFFDNKPRFVKKKKKKRESHTHDNFIYK